MIPQIARSTGTEMSIQIFSPVTNINRNFPYMGSVLLRGMLLMADMVSFL